MSLAYDRDDPKHPEWVGRITESADLARNAERENPSLGSGGENQ